MTSEVTAAMTDTSFWGWTIVVCLTMWLLAALFIAGLAKAAGRPAPRPTLADQLENARSWDPVAEAEAITRSAS